jgi:hypothetical protein
MPAISAAIRVLKTLKSSVATVVSVTAETFTAPSLLLVEARIPEVI